MINLRLSLLALMLSACASNTVVESRHFLLPYPIDITVAESALTMHSTIRLKSISLPSYLQKQNIALVNTHGQVFQAANHFWAEPLEYQLEGITLPYLAERLPAVQWLSPAQYQIVSDYLTIHLEQFYADPDGTVSVSGYWTLWSKKNDLIRQVRFQYQDTMQQEGYLAMTQTLSALWFHSVVDHLIADLLADTQH